MTQPRIAQPYGHRERRIDIADEQLLRERRGTCDHLSLGIDHAAAAVEDQLVLASDDVAERDVRDAVACARAQHLLARLALAQVVGRRREVRDHRCACRSRGLARTGEPDVLADRDRHERPPRIERERPATGRERAGLVEHAVVRQQPLVVARDDLAAHAERGGVARPIAVEHGQTHQERRRGLGGERLELARAGREEARAQDEVLGGIAGDGQLGRDDEIGPLPRRIGTRIGDASPVLAQGADRQIQLGECDSHLTPSVSGR